MKAYIKFLDKRDVFALNAVYDLVPGGEPKPLLVCPRCGDNLYLPVDIDEKYVSVAIPIPSSGYEFINSSANKITVNVIRELSAVQQQRLRQFYNIAYISNGGYALYIDDVSPNPMKHTCKDLIKENEQVSNCCQ